MKNKLALGLLLLGFGLASAQETYSTWGHFIQVSVNTASTGTGAGVGGTVTNFPLLLRLTSANAATFSQAAADGSDIRFSIDGVTRLKHQKIRWNPTAKVAEFWVLVPSIAGNAVTNFNMYWGKTGAADSSSGPSVFDTTSAGGNFKSVWHLSETNDTVLDATGSGYTGVPDGTGPTAAVGAPLPGGLTFDGASTALYFPTPTKGKDSGITSAVYFEFGVGAAYTATAWLKSGTSNSGPGGIISHGNQDWQLQQQLSPNCNANSTSDIGCYAFSEWASTGTYMNAYESDPLHDTTWHYVVGMRQTVSPYLNLYIDGVLSASSTTNDGGSKTTGGGAGTYQLVLGAYPTSAALPPATADFFLGSMVEATIAKVARDTNWIKLSYATQKSTQTSVTFFGLTLGVNPTVGSSNHAALLTNTAGNGLSFQIQGSQAAKANVSLVDMWGRTVWNRTVDLQNTHEIIWNGNSNAGQKASLGVYVARVALLDANNKTTQVLEKQVPFVH